MIADIDVMEGAASKLGAIPRAKAGVPPVGKAHNRSAARSDPILKESRAVPLWKRPLDVTCIVLASPVLLPAMIVIGVVIRVLSDGPSMFRQERIGHRGKPFTCLKFRTMVVGCDPDVHHRHLGQILGSSQPMTKMDLQGDARLIPLGWLLRSTGLDELPQIINVLRGEMSLVGPRPCVRFEYEYYQPWQKERFSALPGLTGLWQVSGKNHTTFDEMILLDIEYSRNVSLWSDLGIMAKTPLALLAQTKETGRELKGGRLARRKKTKLDKASSLPAATGMEASK